MPTTIQLNNHIIGDNNPTYIIAEMSANHAGSLKNAKEIVYAAKEAGADCIKMQTYTADTITLNCNNKYFQIDNGTWKGENLYQLYKKAYTPWEWQAELKELADNLEIDMFSTPFDRSAVDFLENINMKFYKIASFELVDIPLIDYVASKNKPIIMSTGMGSYEEIEEAVHTIRKYHDKIILLKCSSAYPAITDEMNLNTMIDMKKRFNVSVGLSDHSMGSLGAVTAVAMGANVIEKHFCLSRSIDNPDASFSMEPNEFKEMVNTIRTVEKAKGKVYYGPAKQEINNLNFRKSIFTSKKISKGEIFTSDNIRVVRPAYGMKPKYYEKIIGNKAAVDIDEGMPLREDEIDNWN